MCFSAEASFAASTGLILLGGASFLAAKKRDKLLAIIPLLFAAQQAIEGIQWLYLDHGSSSLVFAYAFLFFALLVWPMYVPASTYFFDKKRRWLHRWFAAIGTAVSFYFLGLLLTQPLAINQYNNCISYSFNLPYRDFVNTAYLIAIFGPLFCSSYKVLNIFGALIFVFATISWFFYITAFTSVWCFYAAVVSSMFFLYVRYKKAFDF